LTHQLIPANAATFCIYKSTPLILFPLDQRILDRLAGQHAEREVEKGSAAMLQGIERLSERIKAIEHDKVI
jgi:hypothetical protein